MIEALQYHFSDAIGGFFELPTRQALTLLPKGLQPLETRHGQSVFSLLALDFHHSPIGPYGELILSVLVAPHLFAGQAVPRSAFFPYRLGVTHQAARQHAIERWRLPHYPADIQMDWKRSAHRITVCASQGGQAILEMSVGDQIREEAHHSYQAFMEDEEGLFSAIIQMDGNFCENEDEGGALVLQDHPLLSGIWGMDIESVPFRELWMRDGVETFHPLRKLRGS